MEEIISIRNYIPIRFSELRKNNQFIDCIIETDQGEIIKAHRAILARYSNWFHEYFMDHNEQSTDIQKIKLPLDPDNVMPQVIDFLYDGHIHFTALSIVSFLHCSDFYKIQILERIANDQLIEAASVSTSLFFAQQLIKRNLTSKYIFLAPLIASQLKKIIDNKPSILSKQKIFESINPRLFHEVLLQKDLFKLDDFVKAEIIDEFVGDRTDLSEEDKHFLASVIEWGTPNSNRPGSNSYKILVNFKCNWVPSNISRPFFIYVINVRRQNINALEEIIKSSTKKADKNKDTGRWFLFPWLNTIEYSSPCTSNPQIKVIDFISRLGYLNYKIDAVEYGFFFTGSSKPVSSDFKPQNAFLDSKNFLTQLEGDNLPFISINFGSQCLISADQINIRCHPTEKENPEARIRPPPGPLNFIGQSKDHDPEILAKSMKYEDLKTEGDYKALQISPKYPFQQLTIAQDTKAQYGNNVLRIFNIEIQGKFLL